jgi:hypothetical protein
MINQPRFQRAVSEALSRLKILSEKYKPLMPYLVFTSGGKQTDFTVDIDQVLKTLPTLDENTRIEVRIHILRHSLIRRLKKDPLIDRELTLQSDASIRIMMGTLDTLSKIKAKFILGEGPIYNEHKG